MDINDKDFAEFMKQAQEGAGGGFPDFKLEEFGLSEETINALKPRIGQIVAELVQGAHQFAEEEKQIIKVQGNITNQIGSLLAQNINSARSFLLTLATLSITIGAAVISVIASGHNIFKETVTVYIGLGFLSLCIVLSVLYLLDRISHENKNLTKRLALERSIMQDFRDLMKSYYAEKKTFDVYFEARKTFLEKTKKLEDDFEAEVKKQSKAITLAPAVISYSFLIGLALIGLGFVL